MNIQIDDYDCQRYAILFVDDEANTRKYFRRLFGEKFRILEAGDGGEALKIFHQHADEIGVIVTDQRMPNETGVEFLSKIADDYPDIIKILSTAYSDMDAAIGSVNQGDIFRYMTKPWDIPQLELTLRRAMEFFMVKRERDALLGAKVQAMGPVLMSCRLSAFALVPVCSQHPCKRAAEAIATFIKAGLAGQQAQPEEQPPLQTPTWSELHARQVTLASALEQQLPKSLATDDLEARVETLRQALATASGAEVTLQADTDATLLTGSSNPLPGLLQCLVGPQQGDSCTRSAVEAIAGFIAIYDAGATIHHSRGEGLALRITRDSGATASDLGSETAKWLFDGDMLISAATGQL